LITKEISAQERLLLSNFDFKEAARAASFFPFFQLKYPTMLIKRSTHIILFSLAMFFSTFSNAQSCYELVWSDEFNYNGLPDSTKWYFEEGGGGWGNNELQYYTSNRLENASVDTGFLTITAREETFGGRNYTSARIITYPTGHSFQYGKIEARMRLPYGQGIWPAFWMLGDGIFEGTSWPACGEIDIMEMIGGGEGRDDKIYGTIHYDDNGHAEYGGSYQLSSGIFADDFHTFSIEWTPTSIKWYIDGVNYHSANISLGYLSEFQEEFFILLNIAVGGNWPGNPDDNTVFPQQMAVDYVRVYQLNAAPTISGESTVNRGQKNITFSTVENDIFTYNWTVPNGVTILEGQNTSSITVDWGCEAGTVTCEVAAVCDTYTIDLPVEIEDISIIGSSTAVANSNNNIYRVNEIASGTYTWTVPDGVTFEGTQDTSAVSLTWGSEPGYIKVNVSGQCGDESDSLYVYINSQLPYPDPATPHAIPGTIEAVHYDYGGEGIAYHDSDAINEGSGSRQDEGVDTEPNDGGENIGWIKPGEWVEYTVSVDTTDLYNLEIRTASQSTGGEMIIYFNGTNRTGTITVPVTGSWTNFTSIDLSNIILFDTDTLMRIQFVSGEFNISRVIYNNNGVSISEPISEDLSIYPNPTKSNIYIKNQTKSLQYKLVDLPGRIVKEGIIEPNNNISMQELGNGTYFLILYNDLGSQTHRIIKQNE